MTQFRGLKSWFVLAVQWNWFPLLETIRCKMIYETHSTFHRHFRSQRFLSTSQISHLSQTHRSLLKLVQLVIEVLCSFLRNRAVWFWIWGFWFWISSLFYVAWAVLPSSLLLFYEFKSLKFYIFCNGIRHEPIFLSFRRFFNHWLIFYINWLV